MTLNLLQEHRDIKIIQYILKTSQFYFNYFLHSAFRTIFETFSYIVFSTAKIVTPLYSTSGPPVYLHKARDYEVREHIPVPHDNLFQSI